MSADSDAAGAISQVPGAGDEQVHRRRGYLSGGGPEGWGRGVRRALSLLEHVFSLCAHRCLPLGNTLMDKF